MNTRPVLAVALALLFVTAGCQAPVQQGETDAPTETAQATTQQSTTDRPTTDQPTTERPDEETTTPGSDDAAEVTQFVRVSDELPFRVTPIYERVGRMLGIDEMNRPATSVHVEEPPEGGSRGTASTNGFTNLVGIEPLPSAGEDGGVATGAFARGTRVTLYDHPNVSAEWQENVLAHEFVHVYQTRLPVREAVDELDRRRDRPFLKAVMTEGSAEYVQERYSVRYQNESLNQTRISGEWKNASAYVRWRVAPYEYGSRYFAMRLENASGVTDVYDHPPRTAEQVLHGYAPDGERAKELTAAVNATGSGFSQMGATTKGELFVRLALSSELGWERAADASTGWGMDRLLFVDGEDGTDSWAWVLRWDDAAEADEFRGAFADYNASNDVNFRVESVTDETVVVYAGEESFVENANAAGNSSSVTVSV